MDTNSQSDIQNSAVTEKDLLKIKYAAGVKLIEPVLLKALHAAIDKHPRPHKSLYESAWFLQEEVKEFNDEVYKSQVDQQRIQEEVIDILVVCYTLLVDHCFGTPRVLVSEEKKDETV